MVEKPHDPSSFRCSRHAEVKDLLVKKICKDLGIPEP